MCFGTRATTMSRVWAQAHANDSTGSDELQRRKLGSIAIPAAKDVN